MINNFDLKNFIIIIFIFIMWIRQNFLVNKKIKKYDAINHEK